jgi:type II secretory pathway component PulC
MFPVRQYDNMLRISGQFLLAAVFVGMAIAPCRAAAPTLTLVGTAVGIGIRSAAVIMDGTDRSQYLLYEGETLGAAVIEKITSDSVVLLSAGKKEILLLNGKTAVAVPQEGERNKVSPPLSAP